MMLIENEFNLRETVYLITDPDQYKRVVVQLIVDDNSVLYVLACGAENYNAYAHEISREKNILID